VTTFYLPTSPWVLSSPLIFARLQYLFSFTSRISFDGSMLTTYRTATIPAHGSGFFSTPPHHLPLLGFPCSGTYLVRAFAGRLLPFLLFWIFPWVSPTRLPCTTCVHGTFHSPLAVEEYSTILAERILHAFVLREFRRHLPEHFPLSLRTALSVRLGSDYLRWPFSFWYGLFIFIRVTMPPAMLLCCRFLLHCATRWCISPHGTRLCLHFLRVLCLYHSCGTCHGCDVSCCTCLTMVYVLGSCTCWVLPSFCCSSYYLLYLVAYWDFTGPLIPEHSSRYHSLHFTLLRTLVVCDAADAFWVCLDSFADGCISLLLSCREALCSERSRGVFLRIFDIFIAA